MKIRIDRAGKGTAGIGVFILPEEIIVYFYKKSFALCWGGKANE